MHHHNNTRSLSIIKKVLFMDEKNWPLKWVREAMFTANKKQYATTNNRLLFKVASRKKQVPSLLYHL